MNMYKITVEITETVTKNVGKKWLRIGTTGDGMPEYGYTPEIEKEVEEKKTIYTQVIANLDLYAVIKAINQKG
jgi:hypothetical protein